MEEWIHFKALGFLDAFLAFAGFCSVRVIINTLFFIYFHLIDPWYFGNKKFPLVRKDE